MEDAISVLLLIATLIICHIKIAEICMNLLYRISTITLRETITNLPRKLESKQSIFD